MRNRWYSTIESTDSAINILGPQIKFRLNKSWTENNDDKKIGAVTVVGRGIKKISLDNILKRSATIWNAPLRPIKVGPIRLWAKANILRSNKTMNSTVSTQVRASNKANSWILSG